MRMERREKEQMTTFELIQVGDLVKWYEYYEIQYASMKHSRTGIVVKVDTCLELHSVIIVVSENTTGNVFRLRKYELEKINGAK